MKIAVAQTRPFSGDIEKNIANHLSLIKAAIKQSAEVIIFPELSITGYEPTLAEHLAFVENEERLIPFQALSNQFHIIIGIGLPLRQNEDLNIGLLLFHPNAPLQVYAKHYLHEDELPFFNSRKNNSILINGTKIGLAICYELSVLAHRKAIKDAHAKVFIASVAKSEKGRKEAYEILSKFAKENQIPTILVNCVGPADDFVAVGQSAIWTENGKLVSQLDGQKEGLLFLNN